MTADQNRQDILGLADRTARAKAVAAIDIDAHPFDWITLREWRSEPTYIVIDTRVPDGVAEQEPGSFVSHILRPAALVSAHREIGEMMDALEAAIAAYHGITEEDLAAERTRRLLARLAGR